MKTLNISEETHAKLKDWSQRTSKEMQACATEAIDMWIYRQQHPAPPETRVIRAHNYPGVVKP